MNECKECIHANLIKNICDVTNIKLYYKGKRIVKDCEFFETDYEFDNPDIINNSEDNYYSLKTLKKFVYGTSNNFDDNYYSYDYIIFKNKLHDFISNYSNEHGCKINMVVYPNNGRIEIVFRKKNK